MMYDVLNYFADSWLKVLEKKYFTCYFDSASRGKNSVHISQGGNNATVKKKRNEGSHGHLQAGN